MSIPCTTAVLLLVASASATPPAFTNRATSAGVGVSHSTSGFNNVGYSGGACVGDFNNDGFQDLFFISGGNNNKPDCLFINNGDGTFTNQAPAWGLTAIHKGKGASVTDFNNDGWLDLYVTSAGPAGVNQTPGHNKLYKNNGNGTFTNVALAAGVNAPNPTTQDSWGSTWGDFDHDGDLDLFVCGFSTSAAGNAGNRLFRNNGNETFTDITNAIGLMAGLGPIAGFSPRFVDMDGDRWPELILAGDFKGAGFIGSRYFRNNGGVNFTDVTLSAQVGLEENGMGETVGDFDNDGLLDFYVTSIYYPSFGWTGNKLYRNIGAHHFVQLATTAGVSDGGYGWGTVAQDFNNDGWTDLVETNGDTTTQPPFGGIQSYLWMNNGNLTFAEQSQAAGFLHFGPGRCLIQFDYDNDGDLDLVLCANNSPLSLFRNDLDHTQPDTHWLRVFLDTAGTNNAPRGIGAIVRATTGAKTFMRAIDVGTTHIGVGELSAHFGVGNAGVIDELKVEWPDGTDTIMNKVAVDQTITVHAASPCPDDLNGDHAVDALDLAIVLGQWSGKGIADRNGDGTVNAADLAIMLGSWGTCR